MEEFLKSKRLKVFCIIAAVLAGCLILSAFREGRSGTAEGLISYAAMPVQTALAKTSASVTSFFDRFTGYGDLLEEKEKLQQEMDTLRQQLVDYEAMKEENNQLREMIGLKEEHPDYQFVKADVVGRDPDQRYESFTIGSGSVQGISLHDPVVTSSGLVGWIEEIGPSYAVVTTILSPKLSVGAYEIQSGQLGVVGGQLSLAQNGRCEMRYLQAKAKLNGIIATSGEGGIYPRGIVIGTLREISQESGGTSYRGVIEPANQMEDLTTVFVITDFTGQGSFAQAE